MIYKWCIAHLYLLTHWGRVTHICVGELTIIGSDNGLSPGRRQAIISTNAGILLIGPLRTNFSDILSEIHSFSFKEMHLKMASAKWRPFCFGLNVLKQSSVWQQHSHEYNFTKKMLQLSFDKTSTWYDYRNIECIYLSVVTSNGIIVKPPLKADMDG